MEPAAVNTALWPPTNTLRGQDLQSVVHPTLAVRMQGQLNWNAAGLYSIARVRCPGIVKAELLSQDFRRELYAREEHRRHGCPRCHALAIDESLMLSDDTLVSHTTPLREFAMQFCICGLNPHITKTLNQLTLLNKVPRLALSGAMSPEACHEDIQVRKQHFVAATHEYQQGRHLLLRMDGNESVYHSCPEMDDVNSLCTCELSQELAAALVHFLNGVIEDPEAEDDPLEEKMTEMRWDLLQWLRKDELADRMAAYHHCARCYNNQRLWEEEVCVCFRIGSYLDDEFDFDELQPEGDPPET